MKGIISDKKIIDALNSVDEEETNWAFRYLYKSHYPMALKFVMRNNGDEDEAADVFQDVLIGFYQNIKKGKFKGGSSIKTYLYSMVRNQWLVRLKKIMKTVSMDVEDQTSLQAGQANPGSQEALRKMVGRILDEIGPKCSELLKRYYFDNLPMSEIAVVAGYENENSAKTQKYKCMKKLIKLVEGRPGFKEAVYELLAGTDVG
ncbi:MAG: hypothetical protein B6D64_13710 [Bacteroidetes bacterium 4484_276]|nr:MAG: hypothetical protein B6D64_13710 [Bacteroidetes bacterium 4484_276]